MATWKFTYWFEHSEWFEWETDITEQEAAIISESIEKNIPLNDVLALQDLLWRVYKEIKESYEEEEEDLCEGLRVYFQDPNDPWYYIK